ncbi:OLC1v1029964C1 [Oldenlandia corymbosa var. corymbosa]|uniref:Eukaryotic translation initiation factor 2 subunit beta n=1 Tax=Oldenlandia corymbosa var. corymbosa TaxID=529605 RepID=A0AAV1CF58_OLDCO|nr:OLC1v1029964C1 [Oldenlandia corymbosa var. corymbosa]
MAEVEMSESMEENLIDSVNVLAGRMEDLLLSKSGQQPDIGPENPVDSSFINKKKKKRMKKQLTGHQLHDHKEYEDLIRRVYNLLYQRNPGLIRRQRTVMNPPELLRGAKKTVFVNFMNTCARMCREPQHVMNFLLTELGTNGSIDGQQRLVVEGRFVTKHFEFLLRKYHNEFVVCDGCKSRDTILSKSKENRIVFLECQDCGSVRSVAPIKVGFVARVGRRKAAS